MLHRAPWMRLQAAMSMIAAVSIGTFRVSHALQRSAFLHMHTGQYETIPTPNAHTCGRFFTDTCTARLSSLSGLQAQPVPLAYRARSSPRLSVNPLFSMATTSHARQQRRQEKKGQSERGLRSNPENGRGGRRVGRAKQGDARTDTAPSMAELKERPEIAELLGAGGSVVVLAAGKARLFFEGNPVVYGGAVHAVLGTATSGETVFVVDRQGSMVGWGCYNEDSMYRVRMLWLCGVDGPVPQAPQIEEVLAERFRAARAVRAALRLPRPGTDAYRLVNGEGDRLSGLVVDVYGATAVLSSSARWVEVNKAAVMGAFAAAMPGEVEVVWRRSLDRLRQDGLPIPTKAESQEGEGEKAAEGEGEEDAAEGGKASAEGRGAEWDESVVVVEEHGVKFAVAPRLGHKTGHYLDQRENRRWLGQLCEGKEVLDTFCYSGGFSVNAALAGASRVDAVDSSAPALALAARNAELNAVDTDSLLSFHRADVARFLAESVAAGKQWDVIVLDPPKLAPSRKDLDRAKTKYKKLNKAALQCVRPGGLLMSCTCSAAMAQTGTLLAVIRAAAAEAGRQVTVVSVSGPGGDHPVSPAYPEGQYLTAYLLAVN